MGIEPKPGQIIFSYGPSGYRTRTAASRHSELYGPGSVVSAVTHAAA
jgi:hypothetical protein